MGEALPHVQVPNGDRSIVVADCGESVHCVAHRLSHVLRWVTPTHAGHVVILPRLQGLLLVRQGNVVHLGVLACVHLTHSLLAPDVEEQDLLVCTHTDCKRTVCGHLNRVNVTTVAA